MKHFHIITMITVALLVCGCKKDDPTRDIPEGAILLSAEGFDGSDGTKISVHENSVQWVGGEAVTLDRQNYSVVVSGQIAYVLGFTRPSVEYFSYYNVTDAITSSVTVPSEYTSSYIGGRQVIQLPLVAKTQSDDDVIRFRHVSAAVRVRVKNSTGVDVVLDSVVVSSAINKLSGSVTISNWDGYNPSLSPQPGSGKVKVVFSDTSFISAGGNDIKEVQVPILPTSQGDLTISVHSHVRGTTSPCTFTASASAPALGRNVMMTAQINLKSANIKGLFSVSDSLKVFISQGNLQYQASSQTWRFAEHQYDRIGNAAGNTTEGTNRLSQEAWIDLFGWGTGNNPTLSATDENYSTFTDWGINTISNGGTGWRTLTSEEWKYLLTQRNASTVSGVANARYAIARVYEQNGLIIFPDVYEHPVNVDLQPFINQTNIVWTSLVQINSDNWRMMEAAGAVFLPAAGYRGYENGSLTIFNVDNEGDYWSSTVGSGTARRVMFSNSNTGDFATSNGVNPYLGYSVRLVKNAN